MKLADELHCQSETRGFTVSTSELSTHSVHGCTRVTPVLILLEVFRVVPSEVRGNPHFHAFWAFASPLEARHARLFVVLHANETHLRGHCRLARLFHVYLCARQCAMHRKHAPFSTPKGPDFPATSFFFHSLNNVVQASCHCSFGPSCHRCPVLGLVLALYNHHSCHRCPGLELVSNFGRNH